MGLRQHYASTLKCSKCRYTTNCAQAIQLHILAEHGKSSKKPQLPEVANLGGQIHCVCGFSSDVGNQLAKHMALCLCAPSSTNFPPLASVDGDGAGSTRPMRSSSRYDDDAGNGPTLNGERGARPKEKAPVKDNFVAGNIYSDVSFLKRTAEKCEQRNKATKKNIQKPKVLAEFLEAQNKRSATACEESSLAHFSRMEIVLTEIIEVPKLPELTKNMQSQISEAMRPNPKMEQLVKAFDLRIKRVDMQTLCGTNWLNDEIINFYMNLLIERGKKDGFLNVYAFNTFFYPKLLSGGHASLKRWTRKIDIFGYEVVIVPVHLVTHWCLASIDFRVLTIAYYDSMGSQNEGCLLALELLLPSRPSVALPTGDLVEEVDLMDYDGSERGGASRSEAYGSDDEEQGGAPGGIQCAHQ